MAFVPIRVGTLRPNLQLGFDLYVKVGKKNIHYVHLQDAIDASQLDRLKAKKVRKLYINDADEPKYLEYLDTSLNDLKDESVSIADRGQLAKESMVLAAERADKALESEDEYHRLEEQIGKIRGFLLTGGEGALNSILGAGGIAEDIFHHASNVSSMSVGLGGKIGIKDPNLLLELGIGGLLHDFGKQSLGLTKFQPISSMTLEERRIFESHASVGAELLKGKEHVSAKIIAMIESHEEVGNGEGYPNKRNLKRLPLEIQVLSLCNAYDQFSIETRLEGGALGEAFFEKKGSLFEEAHIIKLLELLEQ